MRNADKLELLDQAPLLEVRHLKALEDTGKPPLRALDDAMGVAAIHWELSTLT